MYKVTTDYIVLRTNILTEQLYTLILYKSRFLHYHLNSFGDGASDEDHIHHERD
jgi:hypothetical protein